MLKYFMLAVALVAIPAAGFAHGPAPAAAHGGLVAESSAEQWVELVIKGDEIVVYVSDENNKPIVGAAISGKAMILSGGKNETAALAPSAANSLTGKLAAPVAGKATIVVTLTVSGKSAQVRFVVPQ